MSLCVGIRAGWPDTPRASAGASWPPFQVLPRRRVLRALTYMDNWEAILVGFAVAIIFQKLVEAGKPGTGTGTASGPPNHFLEEDVKMPATGAPNQMQLSAEQYYPCKSGTLRVIVGGLQVRASHDVGCAGGGSRHMIDHAFLSFIEREPALVPSTVSICHDSTKQPGRVVGQLPKLHLQACVLEEDPHSQVQHPKRGLRPKGFVELTLHDVLVVDSLPVPLHVSLDTLKPDPPLGQPFDHEFKVGMFPKRYKRHAYWAGPKRVTR